MGIPYMITDTFQRELQDRDGHIALVENQSITAHGIERRVERIPEEIEAYPLSSDSGNMLQIQNHY